MLRWEKLWGYWGLPPAKFVRTSLLKLGRRGRAFATRRPTHRQQRAQTGRSIPQPKIWASGLINEFKMIKR